MHRTRAATAVVPLLVVASVATGCFQSQGCPGWAGYETPSDAADAATAVVVGHVDEPSGTAQLFGATGTVWTIDVEEWTKGDGPDRIDVLSPPSACGPGNDPYLGVDPFETATGDAASVIFLSGEEGDWMAISPGQGIVAANSEGGVPESWPEPR